MGLSQALSSSASGSAGVPTVSVIVPTYCEAENLPELVSRVHAALSDARLTGEIIIVDDNSPDNTREVCDTLAESFPVRLLVRENERGLSTAVLHGMRQARGEILVVMDADLSHPPEKIPELVEPLQSEEADFTLGSRYTHGGGVDERWGWLRRVNSLGATLLVRPLVRVRDPMSGFFAVRRSTLEAADNLNPIGYKIGLEILVKCRCKRPKEVPITFSPRQHGKSKLTLAEQVRYLRHVARLYEFRLGHLAQPAKFLLVGSTGMVVDLVSFMLLLQAVPYAVARALAIWLAMSWNFTLNRNWTFSTRRTGPILLQYALFCLSCLLGAVVNWTVSVQLISRLEFFMTRKWLAAFCGIVAGTAFNYCLCLKVVFRSGGPAPADDASRPPGTAS